MTLYRNLHLFSALCAILSRNTENWRQQLLRDLRRTPPGTRQHFLLYSSRTQALLFPEEAVYCRESQFHVLWLRAAEALSETACAFALACNRRNGALHADLVPLDLPAHAADIEINAFSSWGDSKTVHGHLHCLHEVRQGLREASFADRLHRMETAYLARDCAYRPGFRRICRADAALLLQEERIPIFRLDSSRQERGSPIQVLPQDPRGVFGISTRQSAAYDRWQTETLHATFQTLVPRKGQMQHVL